MRIKKLLAAGSLLLCLFILGGCGEFAEEIKQINAGVEALGGLDNGHILMTAHTAATGRQVDGFDADYTYDYRYRIDVRSFNFVVEKRNQLTGNLIEPPYRVIEGRKYDLETGAEDEEYDGDIGDFPDLLSFFFKGGLKNSFVGSVEPLSDAEHAGWQGWRVYKNEAYIKRVNSSRNKNGADGLMQENYVDYWLDEAGVLVRMDYFSRDSIVVDEVNDEIEQLYIFEMLDYNKPELADF